MLSRTLQSWGSSSTELQQEQQELLKPNFETCWIYRGQGKSQSLYKVEVQGLEHSYSLRGDINSCGSDCLDQWVETTTVAEQSQFCHLSREVKVNGPFWSRYEADLGGQKIPFQA